MNDNIAHIFQRNKLKTSIESTKELISKKKAPDIQKVHHLSIANGKPNTLGLTSSNLKTDRSVKCAKNSNTVQSIQTLEMHIGKLSIVNTMNTRVNSSLIMKINQSI